MHYRIHGSCAERRSTALRHVRTFSEEEERPQLRLRWRERSFSMSTASHCQCDATAIWSSASEGETRAVLRVTLPCRACVPSTPPRESIRHVLDTSPHRPRAFRCSCRTILGAARFQSAARFSFIEQWNSPDVRLRIIAHCPCAIDTGTACWPVQPRLRCHSPSPPEAILVVSVYSLPVTRYLYSEHRPRSSWCPVRR